MLDKGIYGWYIANGGNITTKLMAIKSNMIHLVLKQTRHYWCLNRFVSRKESQK